MRETEKDMFAALKQRRSRDSKALSSGVRPQIERLA